MSLQLRIIGAIAALLLLTLLSGMALLSWHARSTVQSEVQTAFLGAERTVRDTLRSDVQHTVTLREVIASFQGQRHVRASLINEDGRTIVQSQLAAQANPAPAWFARLMMPPTYNVRVPITLPGFPCIVLLTSDPRSEIADVWAHARDTFLTILLFCIATMAVVSVAIATASRFFRKIEAGLLAISDGRYDTKLEDERVPEFAGLARGFNHMARQLDSLGRANRQLYAQLQGVQEEERAHVARDLHDEVGPYLFALQVDAKAVDRIGTDEARHLGASIREVVSHIQEHVQAIIRQLKPISRLEFGLGSAIDDIVTFWKRRHPEIAFAVSADLPGRMPAILSETVFRIVQEAVSNAVRHGRPSAIAIAVDHADGQLAVTVTDDGTGLASAEPATSLGHAGIAGMRERVRALQGQFEMDSSGGGTRIRAQLPLDPVPEPA